MVLSLLTCFMYLTYSLSTSPKRMPAPRGQGLCFVHSWAPQCLDQCLPQSRCSTCLLSEWMKKEHSILIGISQFSSVVAQSCPTLCDPMNRSTPDLPVHHQLLEFTQTHVHWVGDAIQPSHPLSSPSPPAPNPSQHQSLFQWVNSLPEVAKVLEFQL